LSFAVAFTAHFVQRAVPARIQRTHRAPVFECDAAFPRLIDQEVLEHAAVDLPCGCIQDAADAKLGDVVQIFAAVAEEKSKAELADLLRIEMRAQAKHIGKIIRGDFDGGFADLVRGRARRLGAALQHADRQLRKARAQLQRQRQSSQAAAEDQHVIVRRLHAIPIPGHPF